VLGTVVGFRYGNERWWPQFIQENHLKVSYSGLAILVGVLLGWTVRLSATTNGFHSIPSCVFKHRAMPRYVPVELVVEAIGGEVTKESKVRNNCDNHDVSII